MLPIEGVRAAAYTIPTDAPESDGTFAWTSTTLVVVHVRAGGIEGLGYTYANAATAAFVRDPLARVLVGRDAMATAECWTAMNVAVRNLGRAGVARMAVSALDVALWDLKARRLGARLVDLLGPARASVPVYGSGGFCSYPRAVLQRQLGSWADAGFAFVKMKVGREPARDLARVRDARAAIGEHVSLFVDANGAYTRKQSLDFAERFAENGVHWFEEPVSSDDLEGLRLVRDRGPASMDVSAGEYGYDAGYFLRMLRAGSVDVLQADATRCGGVTGFLHAAALCEAFGVPLSSHCAPALHVALCCAAPRAVHLEWFHDHVRIESRLFDNATSPREGRLAPPDDAGLGLQFREEEAACFSVS